MLMLRLRRRKNSGVQNQILVMSLEAVTGLWKIRLTMTTQRRRQHPLTGLTLKAFCGKLAILRNLTKTVMNRTVLGKGVNTTCFAI
jgi:hypothetical protein